MNLSPMQQEIVNYTNGGILINAKPGTGRMRVLTELINRYFATHEIHRYSVSHKRQNKHYRLCLPYLSRQKAFRLLAPQPLAC
jgi:hypothetical protein